jgi:hypothetical protein
MNEINSSKKKYYIRFILLATLFTLLSTLIQAQTPPVIYIAADGSGDFNCDGISDQVEINRALDSVASDPAFTTVYLKGASTYIIDEPVIISNNTIFTGDSTATIKLKDSVAWWTHCKPVIGQKNAVEWSAWGSEGDSIVNVEIHGFEISGGIQLEPSGDTYIPLIHFYNPKNVKIHDMYLHDSYWDIVRLTSPDTTTYINSEVYNNLIRYSGHEGICFVGVNHFKAYQNRIFSTRTNCGIRAKGTDTLWIYDNIIGNSLANESSGYVGILLENSTVSLGFAEIYNNIIYGKNGGIHLGGNVGTYPTGTRKNVHVHHNKIYKTNDGETSDGFIMDGGIKINGYTNTIIEHNIIESGSSDGIVYEGSSGGGSGYQTIVRNNIIYNNKGYGINNKETSVHTFIADHNLVYNNTLGNYNNTSPTNDINDDPRFAASHSTLNQWHHIVASYNNSTETFSIYVDGKKQAEEKYPGFGSIGINSNSLYIGSYRWLAHWFQGLQDELAIWNRALTDSEIEQLHNLTSPQNISTGLQAYFKMEHNWSDSSGNNFNAVDSVAGFSSNAIDGDSSGSFNGTDNYVQYPTSLSTSNGLTISVWIYRTGLTGEYQTILNKGSEDNNNHIWLYFKKESVMLELGNGIVRHTLEANIVNPEDIDFHVMSKTGRWNGNAWVRDTIYSPCIDSGSPATDYSAEPLPNGETANIGAYGNTSEASKSKTFVYYVSTSGNDANSGLSIADAWKTVRHAAGTLTAGDSVYILAGTYTDTARVIVENSGSVDNYIVFTNYQNDTVILDGTGIIWPEKWFGLFDISYNDYIAVTGLKVKNSDYTGIWADHANHIIINNNRTYNTKTSGIGVWNSSNVTVSNNEVELACNDGEQECISVSNSGYCEIFKNHIHDNGSGDNGGEGIDVKQGSHHIKVYQNEVHHLSQRIGIYVDAYNAHTYNIDVFNNKVHHCGNNGLNAETERGALLEYVNFYNNLVYYNKWDGIALGSTTPDTVIPLTPVKHIKIINNTLYKNGSFENGWGYGILVKNDDLQDVVIRNNICSQNSAQIAIEKIDSLQQVDHNLIDGYNGTPFCLYGSDSIVADPLFVDTIAFDFHLQAASPAINTGYLPEAPNIDYDSVPRPLLSNPDMGAYEYGIFWKGTISNNWHTAGNWSNGQIPLSADSVTIPQPAFYQFYPTINSNAQVKRIVVNDSAKLMITSGNQLEINE